MGMEEMYYQENETELMLEFEVPKSLARRREIDASHEFDKKKNKSIFNDSITRKNWHKVRRVSNKSLRREKANEFSEDYYSSKISSKKALRNKASFEYALS